MVAEIDEELVDKLPDLPQHKKEELINEYKYQVYAEHNFKNELGEIQNAHLPIDEESHGTRNTYIIGTLIHQALENGRTILIDELDTSLHTNIVRTFVELFQSPMTNPKGAQLIFTTHDTNIMNQRYMRKDQIWLVEKDKNGVTDLYSLQDFPEAREDTPFEKWYLAGKFGGLPIIPSVEEIYADESEN